MPRVDRRDHRLEVDLRAGGMVDRDPVAGEQPGVGGMAVERHVGEPHAVFGRQPRKLHPPLRSPRLLPVEDPRHRRSRLRRQPVGRPFDPGERGHDRAASEGGRGDRDDVARGLEHEAADGIDPRHGRPVDLPASGRGEGLEVEHLGRKHFVVLRKMEASAARLLPGGKRPAVAVGEAPVLLHRHVALPVDRPGEQGGAISLPRHRPGPERRVRQHAIPERAGVERLRRVQGMHLLERLHRRLLARHDESRQVGGSRDPGEQHERRGQARQPMPEQQSASDGGNQGARRPRVFCGFFPGFNVSVDSQSISGRGGLPTDDRSEPAPISDPTRVLARQGG